MKLAALVLVLANLACLPFGNQPVQKKLTQGSRLTRYRQKGIVLRIEGRKHHVGQSMAASQRKARAGSQSSGGGPMGR